MPNPFRPELIEGNLEVISRVPERAKIREALETRGSRLLVQGRWRMGKTTLCKSIVSDLKREGAHVILVDFSTATQMADLSNVLLRNITENLGRIWREYPGNLMRALNLQLETDADPNTGKIKVRLKSAARKAPIEEQRQTFLGILNQANALAKKKKIHLGIVIDEFQELGRFEQETTFWSLRGEIQHHANISYVFTGFREHIIRMLMVSDREFYEMFSVLNFEPIPFKEMRNWLNQKFMGEGVDAKLWLDHLLEKAGSCTVDRLRLAALSFPMALRAGELTTVMIDRAFEAIIEEDKPFFHRDWKQMTAHQQNVLRAFAEGEHKLTSKSVRERYSLPGSGSTINTIKSLLERGILYNQEDSSGYVFDSPYFQQWVHLRNKDDLGFG